jgi:hypothetical protein
MIWNSVVQVVYPPFTAGSGDWLKRWIIKAAPAPQKKDTDPKISLEDLKKNVYIYNYSISYKLYHYFNNYKDQKNRT